MALDACLGRCRTGVTSRVDTYQGKRFNSPDDVVCADDGALWFTDPAYGLVLRSRAHSPNPNSIIKASIASIRIPGRRYAWRTSSSPTVSPSLPRTNALRHRHLSLPRRGSAYDLRIRGRRGTDARKPTRLRRGRTRHSRWRADRQPRLDLDEFRGRDSGVLRRGTPARADPDAAGVLQPLLFARRAKALYHVEAAPLLHRPHAWGRLTSLHGIVWSLAIEIGTCIVGPVSWER